MNYQRIPQYIKAVDAFQSAPKNTLTSRQIVKASGCINPSNLIFLLEKRKGFTFERIKNKRVMSYKLVVTGESKANKG